MKITLEKENSCLNCMSERVNNDQSKEKGLATRAFHKHLCAHVAAAGRGFTYFSSNVKSQQVPSKGKKR